MAPPHYLNIEKESIMKMNTAIATAAIELRNQVMADVVSQLVGEVRAAVKSPARFKFNVGTVEYALPSAQAYTELLVKSRAAYAKTFNVLGVQPNEVGTFTAGAKTYVVEWSPTNKTRSWAVANAVVLTETGTEKKAMPNPPKDKKDDSKTPTEDPKPKTPKQPKQPPKDKKDKKPAQRTTVKPENTDPVTM